jgi:hypothetical protein
MDAAKIKFVREQCPVALELTQHTSRSKPIGFRGSALAIFTTHFSARSSIG